MTNANKRLVQALAVVLGCGLVVGTAQAQTRTAAPAAVAAAKLQHWSASGGTVGLRWNRDLAGDIGLVLGTALQGRAQADNAEVDQFDLVGAGSLDFMVRNGNLSAFVGGALQARGGYQIQSRGGRIDLGNFRLSPRAGNSFILDVVGADGKAWFYVDRLMYELVDDKQRLAVHTMDMRITPALAAYIGHPEVANWAIADMSMTTDVQRQGVDPVQRVDRKWHGTAVPGVPGAVYQADLFMQSVNVQYTRCDTCTGVGGNGRVVFTPSSTLRNNVNNGSAQVTVAGDPRGTSSALWAADIPWYSKFSGNFPPHGNDQHPYLIWNLYRFNADGSIDQIGRSGVKHAFLTTNSSCSENPGDSHILGRGCSDTYSTGNNDTNNALGPRSEIIPSTGVWGRCGSIFDTNCDGIANASGNGSYDHRLIVRESQISGAAHDGATYLFESWYLARDDINIFNSMSTTRATFTRQPTVWAVGGNDQYRLGPAIDRWVDPAAPGANNRTVHVANRSGNVKVAVKTTDLGGGRWRYDYAAMNLDFARGKTEGTAPNLRIQHSLGFDNFSVPVGTATVTDLAFSDGDLDTENDWTAAVVNGRLIWSPLTRTQTLSWGTMFRFSFIVNQAPVPSAVTMHIATPLTRESLVATGLLAPAGTGTAAAR